MKDLSKVAVKDPSFKRGETIEDQKVGTPTAKQVSKLLGTFSKWATTVVVLAMVDVRMGGKPRVLEVLKSVMYGLRSRLPLWKATTWDSSRLLDWGFWNEWLAVPMKRRGTWSVECTVRLNILCRLSTLNLQEVDGPSHRIATLRNL